jgi:DNA repair protein RecO (recombination protein O)
MTERNYTTDAIILRNRDYNESDKIVTFFSLEHGKGSGLAKGCRKPKSSLRGVIQPFSYSRLAIAKGKGSLDIITQGETINAFIGLRTDLTKISYASYIAELADAALPEKKTGPNMFALILAAFSLVEMTDDPMLAARFFELRLLVNLGIAPHLDRCHICERRIENGRFYLSPEHGGLLCSACAPPTQSTISAGTVMLMQKLSNVELSRLPNIKINTQSHTEMERALTEYLDYYMEYALRARKFLKEI